MVQPEHTSYDEMPYVFSPHPQSHPDRLATLASLLGMNPQAIDRCRVLELGCAGGGNLIPMASNLAKSQFIGVDFSAKQVTEGQKIIADLGLTNIELRFGDIRAIDASWGIFDYIIAHGVYSWIPPDAQQRLLQICSQNLAEQGVAYVSYNIYPGWHMLRMVRDMMRYHARKYHDPKERVQHARALLLFLARSSPRQDSPYAQMLRHTVTALDPHSDEYLFHEYLEEINEPLYFHQFLEQAGRHGLQYIGEADATANSSTDLPTDVNQVLSRLSADWFERQQYLDFVHGRQFRESLLCHQAVDLDWTGQTERVKQMHLASAARADSGNANPLDSTEITFHGRTFGSLTTTYPVVKTALRHLAQSWPGSVSFQELEQQTRAQVSPNVNDVEWAASRDLLARTLLQSHLEIDLVELHVQPLPLVNAISNKPKAARFSRYQAARGPLVTNQRHESIELTELERFILWKLDGQRDRGELLRELAGPVGQPILSRAGVSSRDAESKLGACLQRLCHAGLLIV